MRTPIIPQDPSSATPTVKIAPPDSTEPPTPTLDLDTTPAPLVPPPRFPQVRGYEILSIVGSGGMGIVYEARHKELNRRVAIKTLRGESLADPSFRERFRAEAEAIAKLQHPNVIQVFEVGYLEPQSGDRYPSPFIALEFVDGGSLTPRTRTPQSPQFAASTLETLARAAHAAHRLGIIHRDLKPANVLLTREGQPKVADFGIAKQLNAEQPPGGQAVTLDGTVMGTPEYMAPEQLEGEPASPAIDIYALGVILYEMLTGHAPFQGATFADTMRLALREEPVPPRRLQPSVPRDLETICLKCLEKTPGKRYESAETLAEDLARWRDGRPIKARPIGTLGRTVRWARRNPAVAMLSVAVFLVTLTGLAGVVWGWREASINASKAQQSAERAEEEARNANEAARKERWERYRVGVLAASSALRLHDINAARLALNEAPDEYRDWLWQLQQAQLDRAQHVLIGRSSRLHGAYYTPDGRWAVVQESDGSLCVWDLVVQKAFDLVPGTVKPSHFALTGDGRTLAYALPDHSVVLCEVATGRTQHVMKGHTQRIEIIQFTPDGARLISTAGDRTARIWDTITGKQIRLFQAPQDTGVTLIVSPDAKFVFARWDGRTRPRMWEMESGREIYRFEELKYPIMSMKFNSTADRLVTVDLFPQNTARVWEIPSGKLIATLRGHENQISNVEFSRDSTRLVSTSMDRTARIWDITLAAAPREAPALLTLRGHTGWIHHATFSPDGKRVVSSGHDRTLRYWDAQTGEERAVLVGHTAEVWSAKFRDDGTMIASTALDGAVRLWDVSEVERDYAIRGHSSFVYGVAFHPDGQRVASSAWDGTTRIWNATTAKQHFALDHGKTIVPSVAYHPNGHVLATLARDNSLRLWNADTGQMLHRWHIPSDNWRDSRVKFSPNGELIAAGSFDGFIRLWDVTTRAEVAVLGKHLDGIRDVAFSPDGRWLASGGENSDRSVRIWDIAAKKEVQVMREHASCVYAVAWNHTGTLLASGSTDGSVRVWNTSTWQRVGLLRAGVHVYDVAFSRDGKLLVCACADNLIRIWHVETGQEIAELSGHREYVHALAFSPDGTRLVSGSGDRTLRVWDTLTPSERAKR